MRNQSKRSSVLDLFFNQPTRQWHFEDILKEAKLSRKPTARWLGLLQKEGLIKRVKPPRRMPYYISRYDNPEYQSQKTASSLSAIRRSGLIDHLTSLGKARTVILFGSMTRWDWHKESDIDLFVLGDTEGIEAGPFESILGRELQVFECESAKDLDRYPKGFLKNIIRGHILKGNIDFLKVTPND